MRRCTRASGIYRRHVCTNYQYYCCCTTTVLTTSCEQSDVGWICMTTIKDPRTLFLRKELMYVSAAAAAAAYSK